MRLAKTVLLASTLLTASAVTAQAEISVVASIKPIHSLVAGVMDGVGEPGLIIQGAGSPHTYAMRPSEAAMLQSADVVFWVGHDLEAFLEGALESIAADAKTVELMDAHDLVKLGFREGGAFEAHDHGDHDDHAHDHGDDHDHGHDEETAEAGHDHDHDHDHEKEDMAEAGHDHDHGHSHGGADPHIWLDPMNAKALVHEIEEALVEADPANAETYEANAEVLTARLDSLIADVETELAGLSDQGFIVFHDAYHYFEDRFGLEAAGAITVSPEVMPGAERIGELRETVRSAGAACVFSEPQFEPRLVSTVVEGTSAKSGVLDPLGAELENGSDLYFELIRNMATSFKDCLTPAS
ncbi:MAG: zinc ABC transporter substrate-binding protein [Roseitalea sp.]|jgi:zinc transport system substrate-binding protein|nr:zinc ABC transporter substrate-binding protein [Roseitalea sp.]MBO6741469.1 zinc ABC transporter substrate-binding protein [Roseitalea sp.]